MSSEVAQTLAEITDQGIKRRGLGRLYTLKILCGHGKAWSTPGQVMKELNEYGTHTNYIFELGGHYPQLVEMSPDKKLIRIRQKAHSELTKTIDRYITQAEQALKNR